MDYTLDAPWKDEANGMPTQPFSLGYVKGMLRASTALVSLHLFWEDGNGEALLMEMFPISQKDVEDHIYKPWLNASHGWDLEMHDVQTERRYFFVDHYHVE